MQTELDELTVRISKLSDGELVKMLTVDHESYRDEALDVGRREFGARNLGTLEEFAQKLRDRPPEPAPFVDVSRCPTRPGSTWPGFVIGGCVLTLEVADGLVSADAQPAVRVAIALLGIIGFLLWLARVDRLHGVLRRATRGTYPIRTLNAVVSHFIPVFNLYWVFRWTNEVVKFVNSRDPSRQMWIGWPGTLLLLGFLARFVDGALSLFILFGVMAFLSRRVESVTQFDSPSQHEPGWDSTASTS